MIRGAVNARYEAVVRLRVRGPGGEVVQLDAVIDTGFTASLALPTATIAALGLVSQSGGRAVLADGSVRACELHAAEVEWGDGWRPMLVAAVGDEALIGMRLLGDHSLRMEIVPGGLVEIMPLPLPPRP